MSLAAGALTPKTTIADTELIAGQDGAAAVSFAPSVIAKGGMAAATALTAAQVVAAIQAAAAGTVLHGTPLQVTLTVNVDGSITWSLPTEVHIDNLIAAVSLPINGPTVTVSPAVGVVNSSTGAANFVLFNYTAGASTPAFNIAFATPFLGSTGDVIGPAIFVDDANPAAIRIFPISIVDFNNVSISPSGLTSGHSYTVYVSLNVLAA